MQKDDIKNELDPEMKALLEQKAGNHKAVIIVLLIQVIKLLKDVKQKIK